MSSANASPDVDHSASIASSMRDAGGPWNEPAPRSLLKDVAVVMAVTGTSFLNSFFSGALTSSLPSIGRDLGYSAAALSWPVTVNALTLGAFLLPFGRVADVYGQRLLWLIGTVLFATFSLGVGLSPTNIGFTSISAILGISSAAYVPAGVGILGSYFEPGPNKNRAFAALGGGQPLGYIAGLVVGALLTTTKAGWRATFYVQSGLSFAFALLGFFSLPSSFAVDSQSIPLTELTQPVDGSTLNIVVDIANNRGIDYIGSLLSITGLSLLTFALADASSAPLGWKTPYLPPLIPISLGLIAAFFLWQVRVSRKLAEYTSAPSNARPPRAPAPPLLAPTIWRAPHVGEILLVVFFSWGSFNTSTYYINLLLQLVLDVSPLKTALFFLPMIISGVVLNFVPGMILHRVPGKAFVASTMLLALVSPLMLALVKIDAQYWPYIMPMMATAPATDLIFSLATVQISKSVPRSQQATAGALFNVTTRLATSMSLALISTFANLVSAKSLAANPSGRTSESPIVLLPGYNLAGYLCTGCVVISLVVSVVGLRGIGVVGKKDVKAE